MRPICGRLRTACEVRLAETLAVSVSTAGVASLVTVTVSVIAPACSVMSTPLVASAATRTSFTHAGAHALGRGFDIVGAGRQTGEVIETLAARDGGYAGAGFRC